MTTPRDHQKGYVLIVTLIILLAVTVLVLNASLSSTMGERMSGNHMDRMLAKQTAELAVRQGLGFLQNNAETCLDACGTTEGIGALWTGNALPTTWDNTGARDITGGNTGGRYLIRQLPDSFRPADKPADCKPYSVMGQGNGRDDRTQVLIQTVAFVCPL